MKNLKYIIVLFVTVILSSCYEEEHFLDNNATSDGRYFPVIQTVSVDNTPEIDSFAVGETVKIIVKYWSTDPIKELVLFDNIDDVVTLISTTPYTYSYDAESAAEKVTLDYQVPAGSNGKEVGLLVGIINENGLSREKTTSIKVLN